MYSSGSWNSGLICFNTVPILILMVLFVVYGIYRHFQQYISYIVAVSFIGGGNRNTQRKPPTCHILFFSSPDPKGQVSYWHHFSSVVRPSTFHILIFSWETTGPIATKLWWNGPWMAPFQNCVRWSRLQTKMATKLKIEKRGDDISIVHCCFSISQNELKL